MQNIHLVARWLGTLEKMVEQYSLGSHADYRVFMSAEPAPSPEAHIIPQGLLENAIKITNEPPTGMYANLHKALDLFTQVPSPWPRQAQPDHSNHSGSGSSPALPVPGVSRLSISGGVTADKDTAQGASPSPEWVPRAPICQDMI